MGVRVSQGEDAVKTIHTCLALIPVRVEVEFKPEEGFFYATVPDLQDHSHRRPMKTTMRSADKETAINEAIKAAGYGSRENRD